MILHSDLNCKRKGFSLTELAIVLGVIGLILSGLWGVVAIVRENMKRSETKEQIYVLVNNVRNHYLNFACATPDQACPPGSTNLTDYLFKKSALPYEMVRDRTAGTWVADHPWYPGTAGGSVRVLAGDAGDVNTDSFFRVELRGVNEDSCLALASKLTGTGTPKGIISLDINGTDFTVLPVAPEDADGPCAGSDTLTLLYTLRAP